MKLYVMTALVFALTSISAYAEVSPSLTGACNQPTWHTCVENYNPYLAEKFRADCRNDYIDECPTVTDETRICTGNSRATIKYIGNGSLDRCEGFIGETLHQSKEDALLAVETLLKKKVLTATVAPEFDNYCLASLKEFHAFDNGTVYLAGSKFLMNYIKLYPTVPTVDVASPNGTHTQFHDIPLTKIDTNCPQGAAYPGLMDDVTVAWEDMAFFSDPELTNQVCVLKKGEVLDANLRLHGDMASLLYQYNPRSALSQACGVDTMYSKNIFINLLQEDADI